MVSTCGMMSTEITRSASIPKNKDPMRRSSLSSAWPFSEPAIREECVVDTVSGSLS